MSVASLLASGNAETAGLRRSRHVGDGNFHAALIFKKDVPGEFEKVDEAAHRVS